jgi:hypothetical protein
LRQDGIRLDPAPLAAFSEFYPEPKETTVYPDTLSSFPSNSPTQDAQEAVGAGETNEESAPRSSSLPLKPIEDVQEAAE